MSFQRDSSKASQFVGHSSDVIFAITFYMLCSCCKWLVQLVFGDMFANKGCTLITWKMQGLCHPGVLEFGVAC